MSHDITPFEQIRRTNPNRIAIDRLNTLDILRGIEAMVCVYHWTASGQLDLLQ